MAREAREGPAGAGEVEDRGNDVFVSYSRADREIVLALTGKLSAAGKKHQGLVRIYGCDVCRSFDDLLWLARSRVTRQLTTDKRAEYLSGT